MPTHFRHFRHFRRAFSMIPFALFGCSSGSESSPAANPIVDAAVVTPVESHARLTPSEVSVLFPLADSTHVDSMWKASLDANGGPLLPERVYKEMPQLAIYESTTKYYQLLRVVALRFDPCFRSTPSSSDCKRQIRLVFQPILVNGKDVIAEDAALHVFYELTAEPFATVVQSLRNMHDDFSVPAGGPLDVHPVMLAQGLDGDYARRLRELVLPVIGPNNLTRATFMLLRARRNEWKFGGFDFSPNAKPMVLDPGNNTTLHTIFAGVLGSEASMELRPAIPFAEDLNLLLDTKKAKEATMDAVKGAVRASIRIENPNLYTPEQVPCATCHVATVTRAWAERTFPLEKPADEDRFQSKEDLTLKTQVGNDRTSFRAFGYFGSKVAISQRTVNETAAVVEALNKDVE